MMKSSFKERIARLGPIQGIDRVPSGSSAVLSLRPAQDQSLNSIAATQALARRGLSLLRAKRVVEEMISRGRIVVTVPKVEDRAHLQADLTNAGIRAHFAARVPDIRELRERLKLTQEQFAVRYGLDVNLPINFNLSARSIAAEDSPT